MRRPDAQRVVHLRGPFGQGWLPLGPRLSWQVALALGGAALLLGCASKKPEQPAEAASRSAEAATKIAAAPSGQQAESRARGQHSGDDHSSSAHPPGPLRPAGPPAIALSPKVRADLTAVRVTAHVGH